MIDILNKCNTVQINPKFQVDQKGNILQVQVTAKIVMKHPKTGAFSYVDLNVIEATLEEAFKTLAIYIHGLGLIEKDINI